MVLTDRPSPVAGLIRSESRRKRAMLPAVENGDSEDGQRPVEDLGAPPAA